jgi:hypothetical protein
VAIDDRAQQVGVGRTERAHVEVEHAQVVPQAPRRRPARRRDSLELAGDVTHRRPEPADLRCRRHRHQRRRLDRRDHVRRDGARAVGVGGLRRDQRQEVGAQELARATSFARSKTRSAHHAANVSSGQLL